MGFGESRTRTAPEHPQNLVTPLGYHTGARWVGGEGRREGGTGIDGFVQDSGHHGFHKAGHGEKNKGKRALHD